MKLLALIVLLGVGSPMDSVAAGAVACSDTTAPRQTNQRPVQAILPGYSLDTAVSSLTKPDPAVYAIVPKWLRAKAAGKPVYVIDGQVAQVNQLKGLKTSAVESVQVIPGKRAVGLYGSVARDGVVAITTKAALMPR